MREICGEMALLFNHSKDRPRLVGLLCLMIFGAVLEMAGLTLLVPIIDVISNPEKLIENDIYARIANFIGADGDITAFVLKFSAVVIGYILLKNIYLAWVNMVQARFIKSKEIETTNRLLASYLTKPYLQMSHRNSADMIRNINQEVNYAFIIVIQPLLILVSELFVVAGLLTLMLVVSWQATVMAGGILGFGILMFLFVVKRLIKRLGAQRQNARGRMIEWATQALHSLKELTVAQKQSYFLNRFDEHAQKTKEAETFDIAMGRIPILFIETFAILTMLSVMIFIFMQGGNFIATLSLFALVLLRLMPTMNRVTTCASRVKFYMPSLLTIAKDLDIVNQDALKPKRGRKSQFNKDIIVEDVSFTYPATDNTVLNGASLNISKGKIISIVGPSGSGKSTFMDIMLGLLEPDTGCIVMDGKDITNKPNIMRDHVSYLPQSVYLLNATIRENIAFGVDVKKIDNKKIDMILKKVGLAGMVKALPDGVLTPIGDISKKISGGQQQRIGIARAMYHDKDILFLDEATAGLDPETEAQICETLKKLTPKVTIISISHQHALINIADEIYTIANGKLKKKAKSK